MPKRVLTQMQAGEIRRLRAELNEWGEPAHSGLQIAAYVGCSESTVWRVLGKQAAYAKMGRIEPGGLSFEAADVALKLSPINGLEEEAAASAARVMARLQVPTQGEEAERELKGHGPSTPTRRIPNPLEGDDVGSEGEGEGLTALQRQAAAMGVDIDKLRSLR